MKQSLNYILKEHKSLAADLACLSFLGPVSGDTLLFSLPQRPQASSDAVWFVFGLSSWSWSFLIASTPSSSPPTGVSRPFVGLLCLSVGCEEETHATCSVNNSFCNESILSPPIVLPLSPLFLRQDFTVYPRLALTSLCSPSFP